MSSAFPAQFRFSGVLGERIDRNLKYWLLPAPHANPGMIEMFRLRDRSPAPDLVPWAGEFAGKYLLSAIPSLRMVTSSELRAQTASLVSEFIGTQGDDGYLGPFPKPARLTSQWDLWGHYYAMEALLRWHLETGDPAALAACQKAADLICSTFLDGQVRPYDAGSQEMNLAVIHAFTHLYQITRQPRYRQFIATVEKDWERAGDYLRTGQEPVEFFQTPRPRWESLPNLQALFELYRISGDEKYRTAFLHHWRSIRRWDRRITGGFSSAEQATGNAYAPTSIETCATVAWMALCLDALRLTGDATIADEFELALFNAAAGAQHPSGCWWTYDTPLGGFRAAATQAIAFQARPGTPLLNCCAANGPRSLSFLTDWAVMKTDQGLVINQYGPAVFQGKLPDGTPIALQWITAYPLKGKIELRIQPVVPRTFSLKLRIPGWAEHPKVLLNNTPLDPVIAGQYLEMRRRWSEKDRVFLAWDMPLRVFPGDRAVIGKAAFYRGPLLLAWDQRFDDSDASSIPSVDLAQLSDAAPRSAAALRATDSDSALVPWILLDLASVSGKKITLCDFASAGAKGTFYQSWLPTAPSLLPAVLPRAPPDASRIASVPIVFRWTDARRARAEEVSYQLVITSDPEFNRVVLQVDHLTANHHALAPAELQRLQNNTTYFWKVISRSGGNSSESVGPASTFQIAPEARARQNTVLQLTPRAGGEYDIEDLASNALTRTNRHFRTDHAPAQFFIDSFPNQYSAVFWTRISPSDNAVHQALTSWTAPRDDPLRITVEKGKLSARLEAGRIYSTSPIDFPKNHWFHLAAVKERGRLLLYQNGLLAGAVAVPEDLDTNSGQITLGGNPGLARPQSVPLEWARFEFFNRPLAQEEIQRRAQEKPLPDSPK